MSSVFDLIGSLPMHPLVVHFAVVLLPLTALSLVVAVFVPWWRERLTEVSFVGLTVAAVLTFVAKESGEALERRVGDPGDHARYGDLMVPIAFVLWVVALAWLVARRLDLRVLATVAGILMTILAVVATGVMILVGHTGASAVWESEVAPSTPAATGAPAAPSSSAAESTTPTGFTMAVVAQHKDETSCYAVVNKNVYDLTTWIGAHPGGRRRILDLCGTDATAAFTAEHGGESTPESRLASFKVGSLSGS